MYVNKPRAKRRKWPNNLDLTYYDKHLVFRYYRGEKRD